jgi:hypothetical protein
MAAAGRLYRVGSVAWSVVDLTVAMTRSISGNRSTQANLVTILSDTGEHRLGMTVG